MSNDAISWLLNVGRDASYKERRKEDIDVSILLDALFCHKYRQKHFLDACLLSLVIIVN